MALEKDSQARLPMDDDELWRNRQWDYVEPFDDPLNELISDRPDEEYYDDDAPSFKLKDAGIFLEPQTVLRIMNIASGKYGYFQRLGQVEGRNSSHALAIASEQIGEISRIVKPILIEQGMPDEKLSSEVDRIMNELRELYSGTRVKRDTWVKDRGILLEEANSKLQESSLRKKELQQSIGEAAIIEIVPPRQSSLDGFSAS